MIKPEILDAMVASGCTAEQIAAVAKAAMSRSSSAERQARYRARKASQSVTSDVTSVTVTDIPSPKKETPPTPPKEKTTPSSSETNVSSVFGSGRASDLSEFKAELSMDLDAERIEAIIKHRRSKKGQLTGHAARLFRRDASECHLSLTQAVDTCISRNWITVKPEYLKDRNSRPPGQASPNNQPMMAELTGALMRQMQNRNHDDEPDEHAGPTVESSASYGNNRASAPTLFIASSKRW